MRNDENGTQSGGWLVGIDPALKPAIYAHFVAVAVVVGVVVYVFGILPGAILFAVVTTFWVWWLSAKVSEQRSIERDRMRFEAEKAKGGFRPPPPDLLENGPQGGFSNDE